MIDILDYSNTNKYKTARVLGGMDFNGSGSASLQSGLWMSTSAVTSITCISAGNNWTTGTQIALYGVN